MKKAVFCLLALGMALGALAQTDSSQNYFKTGTIPAFNLLKLPDSTLVGNNLLKKDTPTVLIFFAPDCDHCQHSTREMTEKIDLLKNMQILMVTWMDANLTNKFYQDYKLASFPNITVTRDPQYNLLKFYGVHSIPDVFVYDKNGRYKAHFKSKIPVEEIAALF